MDTSGKTCESFDFVLNHYSVPFVNSRQHILHLCDNGHFIIIVDNTGNVFIRDLYSGEVLKLSDEPSARVCWQQSSLTGVKQDVSTGQIVSLSHQGHLYVYSVVRRPSAEDGGNQLAVTCSIQCHYLTLKHILQDVGIDYQPPHKDGGFLCCYGDMVTFTCGSTVVRLEVPVDRPPEVRSYFVLPDVEALVQVEVYQPDLVMLNDNKDVVFWSVESGAKVAYVCLEDVLGSATQHILRVSLTADWLHLLVFAPGSLDILSLQSYFETHPEHVTVKQTCHQSQLTPAPGINISRAEDTVWEAKLAQLKTAADIGNMHVCEELSWFEKAGLTRGVVMDAQSVKTSSTGTFKRRRNTDACDNQVRHIVLSVWSDNMSLRDVCAGSQLTYILLQADNEEVQDILFAVQVKSGQTAVHRLPRDSAVILSTSVLTPAMAVTSGTLYAVVFHTQQELVVNRLMLYESASMADALCGLNGWNQCCLAMPVLEMALKHRQLDTIAFFLKSRESVFSKSPDASRQGDELDYDSVELEQLQVVVDHLKAAIKEHIVDTHLRHYGEQLLQLTMAYLHKLSRNVVARLQTHTEDQLHTTSTGILTQLTNYVVELREHMNTKTWSIAGQRQTKTALCEGGQLDRGQAIQMTQAHKDMVQVWDQLDLKAAVVEGILNQQIPLVQTYVLSRFGRDAADLSNIIQLGLEESLALLCEWEWQRATKVLHNMGFHVPTKLREICYYTTKKSLRDYLAARLQQQGHMTAEELQTLNYMHQIEQIYSCGSFETAKLLRMEGTSRHWEEVVDLRSVMADACHTNGAELQQKCGEIAPVDVTNSETASYVHLLLEWVRHWDTHTLHAIVLEQGFYRTDVNVKSLEIQAAVVWEYLCRHQHVKQLLTWIESVYTEETQRQIQPAWPSNLPLNVSVIDDALTTCPAYLTDILLDALASHGVLCGTEQRDMRLVVKRLARIAGIIQQPHLVEHRPNTHCVRLSDLHSHLIEWFIINNLPQLLWFYLDYWKLCETDDDLVGPDKAVPDWVPTLLRFRSLTRQPHDLQCMLGASMAPGGLESHSLMQTLDTMVDQGISLGALATLALSSQTHHQVERPELSEKMSALLAQFPRLQRAYFHAQDTSCSVPASPPDVTVYGLLQAIKEFDMSRLFGWQNTNSHATEDSLKELPHFSLESLVLRYARTDSLTFMYYLKQGRPSFAFGTFLASQMKAGVKVISAKLIHSAVMKCHWLALKYFHQSHIGAACTAFAEMLGHDSTVMRVHLETANEIYTHRCSCEAPTDIEQRKETDKLIQQQTASLLQGCARHRRKSTESALIQLKAATRWHLERHRINCLTLAAGQKWLLPLLFCKCHQMAWPTDFLCDCALQDDWLMFLTYAQLYQFPRSQLRDVLPKFASAHIKEHLMYVLDNVPLDGGQQPRLKKRTRDVRAQLYARIGVANTVTSSTSHNASSSSEDAQSEEEDNEEEDGGEAEMLIPINEQGLLPNVEFTDLFELLFACDTQPVPWKTLCAYAVHLHNPVLAVLAACYEGHSAIWCLCSWLEASLSEESISVDRSMKEWTLDNLTELVRVTLASSNVSLLHTAFTIFQPTCELLSFLEFYLSFTNHAPEQKCMTNLVNFKKACQQKCHDCHDDDVPMRWVEDMVVTVMSHCLRHVTWDSADRLLTLLNQVDVTASFSVPVPPVATLYRLQELTRGTSLPLNYAVLSQPSHPQYTAVCQLYLNDLTTHQLFDVARQFADVAGLPSDSITIQQCNSELSALETSDMWKDVDTRLAFWRSCHHLMAKYHTPPQMAAHFYEVHANVCPTHSERGCLYQLAYDWLSCHKDGSTTTPDSEEMNRLFIQLWKSKIQDCIENGKNASSRCDVFGGDHRERTVTQQSLLKCVNTPAVTHHSTVTLTQQEKAELDVLLGGLLDDCLIADVIRVTSCFGHVNEDLDIVTSCIRLALGTLYASDLAPNVKKVLAMPRSGHRRHTSTSMVTLPRCLSTVSIGTLAALNRESDDNSGDTTLSTMQLLCQQCHHGKQCCTRIIVLYKIAKVLEPSLLELVELEQFEVLRRLLATEHPQKYLHAKSYITTSGLPDSQVAGFLCDGILSALQVHAGIMAAATASDGATIPLLLGNPSKKQTCGIGELIQLCGSPSVMGQRLLDSALALMSSSRDVSHKILWVMVELLIFAHDCHTLACNMEGICAVLHGCRSVMTFLSLADEYNLMIHLLTGIGRFSEMTYIFDMLKQKHQFELLFRKGIEREDKLKVAILDYLKRYHPADTDTLTMVSLHYTLYRQIAAALQERAQGLLATLTTKTLVNTPDVTSKLHKALQYWSDAAETYSKEQCLRHAENCVRQARLVALQIHLLPTSAQVLHLSPEGIKAFVTMHHKFYEAYIVCCAYNDHSYWADAIYQQVVERADAKYLSNLRAHVPLTGSLVEDVAERYRSTPAANTTAPVHMKKLLCCCPDIQTAYRLATELGFSDTVRTFLEGDQGNYLQDIIV